MSDFCRCKDWQELVESYDLFEWSPPYGWIIKWLEVTKEKGYSQIHRYGIPIQYCPKCGKRLESLEDS